MSRVTLDLAYATPPQWATFVLERFDALLADHADCERKAAAQARSLLRRYGDRPELAAALTELAQEEQAHFDQVVALIARRGGAYTPGGKDPYVNALLAHCRRGGPEGFLDRMLVSSLIEQRSAERFRLLREALRDPDLKRFYRDLWASEAKHGNLFVRLALHRVDADTLYARLRELVAAEGEIVRTLPWRAAIH